MKFLDLFAGIGGFRLGMEQAGHECVGYVEWDKFARKSYQAIHVTTNEWTAIDINEVNATDIPRANVWCFGFPCQDISLAGKQKGITNGKQSSLFFTVTGLIRQLKEEDRPELLFIENVKNLLSINKGWDFAKLQIELDEIGYDCEWDVLNSKEVVPQHRERIFIVGHLRGRSTRKVFPITRESGSTNGTNEINRLFNGKRDGGYGVKQIGNLVKTDSFGGNPQVGRVYDPEGLSPTLNTMTGGGREPKIAISVSSPDIIVKNQNGRRFKEDGDPSFTLTVKDRHGIYDGLRIRKLTPRECWRLQGFPDWAFDKAKNAGISNSQLYKQAGNSVTVPVIYEIAKRLVIESGD